MKKAILALALLSVIGVAHATDYSDPTSPVLGAEWDDDPTFILQQALNTRQGEQCVTTGFLFQKGKSYVMIPLNNKQYISMEEYKESMNMDVSRAYKEASNAAYAANKYAHRINVRKLTEIGRKTGFHIRAREVCATAQWSNH